MKKVKLERNPEPKVSERLDCANEMRKLPAAFWLGAPTAQHIPHSHSCFDPKEHSYEYTRRKYSTEAWNILAKKIGRIFPSHCEDVNCYEAPGVFGETNPTYIIYTLPNGTLAREECHQHQWRGMQILCGKEWLFLEHMTWASKERIVKEIDKLDSLWNRLRKKALRAAGKEPSAKIARRKHDGQKAKLVESRRKKVEKQAEKTLEQVTLFVKAIKNNNADESDISAVYFSMIKLAERNKEYKNVAGTWLKVQK